MQERNFEKQVRDKMEEHSLVPSESVWQKVEKQIRKKKERRRVVLWLFTFLLLPAGFLVWQINEGSRRKDIAATSHQPASLKDHQTEIKQPSAELKEQPTNIADQPSEIKKQPEGSKASQTGYSDQPSGTAIQQNGTKAPVKVTNKQPGESKEQQTENSDQPGAVASQQNQIKTPLTGIKNQPEEILKGRQTKSNVATAVPIDRSRTGNNMGTAKAIKTPFSKKQNRKQPSLTNNKGSKRLSLPSEKSVAVEKKKTRLTQSGRDLFVPDKISKNKTGINELVNALSASSVSLKASLGPVELLKAEKGTVSEEITTAGKPRFLPDTATALTIKKDKKWQWSIQASAGASGIHKDEPKASELEVMIPMSQIVSGSASLPPSRIENGFSASGGLRLARKITNRLSVTAALQYHFYSTRIRVGHTVYNDTTMLYSNRGSFRLGSYYLNNQPVYSYYNRYHFVELPLGVEYQLLHKRPLYGHIGVNISQLTSTNALFYHDQAGIYFTGKSLFRKTQASVFGELTYRVARIGKASFVMGPQAQYALTGLMDKNVNGKQHLFFAGWHTRVYF